MPIISPTAISPHRIGGAKNWSSYWKPLSLFFLDGSISGDTFLDISGNGRHFTITGKDFATDWTTGFPYKSAATISAPAADAVLIAADVNNFLYDAGGTPNEIPVVSLFQDIDYEHKIFCKHAEQVVDGNGVETYEPRVSHIFMATNVLTGADLIKAYIDFGVPSKLITAIREVGAGKTYAGIKLAIAAADANDSILIYTGNYNETNYIEHNKILSFLGYGNSIARQTSTAAVFYVNKVDTLYRNLTINCEGKTTNAISLVAGAANDLYDLIVDKCLFANIHTRINGGSKGYIWEFKNSVAVKDTSYVWGVVGNNSLIDTNIIKNAIITLHLITKFYNNKYINDVALGANAITLLGANFEIVNNIFTLISTGIGSNGNYAGRTSLKINQNTFNISGGIAAAISLVDSFVSGQANEIKNNIIQNTDTLSTVDAAAILINNNSADIEENIIKTTTDISLRHISVLFTTNGNLATFNIKRNVIRSAFTGGSSVSVTIGRELAYNDCHVNSVIEGNSIINEGGGAGAGTGLHSLFINCGIDAHIKYNYIAGGEYGIVIKTGTTAKAYTAGGVFGNIINDCNQGIIVRGVTALNVFNNTIIGTGLYGIRCDENSVQAGDQFSENVIIKNNIIYAVTGHLIYFDAHAAANGCTADYNIYYTTVAKPFLIGATEYTFAEWQALGHDAHSVMLTEAQYNALFADAANDDFSLPAGSVAIGAGEILAAAYDDGLAALTDWGSDSEVPTVVTKQRGAAWDCGAYVS